MINAFERKEIEASLKKKLSRFEIYDKVNDKVKITTDENSSLFIQYKKGNYAGLLGTTHFALQIEAETAYLLSIGREEQYRGRGFGRILYNVVEDFCKDRGIKKIQLTFSGNGREKYWQSLGFKRIDGFSQMEKALLEQHNV